MPAIINRLIPFDFTRSPINTVAVENMTRFGIAAAFGIMDFPQDKLKVRVGRFFRAVADAIQ